MVIGWPISVIERKGWTFIGMPECLEDGSVCGCRHELFPCLEALVGANWRRDLLNVLLPKELVWAWWGHSRQSRDLRRLSGRRPIPKRIPLRSFDVVFTQRAYFFTSMMLSIVPPVRMDAQAIVIYWAGWEGREPEFIWTAPNTRDLWDRDAILAWCKDESAWWTTSSVAATHAERVIALYEGEVYCAAPAVTANAVLEDLQLLARQWKVSLISGPDEDAWPGLNVAFG